ncbi:MAG: hypothetical protein WB791_07790 [Waddliaceae bacterium]
MFMTAADFPPVQTEQHRSLELTEDKHLHAHGGGFGLAMEVLNATEEFRR